MGHDMDGTQSLGRYNWTTARTPLALIMEEEEEVMEEFINETVVEDMVEEETVVLEEVEEEEVVEEDMEDITGPEVDEGLTAELEEMVAAVHVAWLEVFRGRVNNFQASRRCCASSENGHAPMHMDPIKGLPEFQPEQTLRNRVNMFHLSRQSRSCAQDESHPTDPEKRLSECLLHENCRIRIPVIPMYNFKGEVSI